MSQITQQLKNFNSRLAAIALLAGMALWSLPGIAATSGSNSIAVGQMTMQLVGGLALFLFGMEQMAESLKAVAGERMKTILAKLTTNRFLGACTGAFTTAVIQSSSITTVLVVSFITAGVMSFTQSIGVIMGSNIGTTITAQIVAFKVTKAALPMIAVGFSMLFFSNRDKVKHYGTMLMGLGLVFFGMSIMSDAMKPLRSYQPFLDLMIQMETPIIGILIAAAFTALIQSSSATTGIVIVMASQGFISLPAGIALAFGANIGTCVTALLASIGKTREAFRASMAHVVFNIVGVLVWVSFIGQLSEWVSSISPSYPELEGLQRLSAETPRQIANAHTIFNIANTLIFIWFTPQIARLIEWMVPDKPLSELSLVKNKYLSDDLLQTPSIALNNVRMELLNMGEKVTEMLTDIMPAILSGNDQTLTEIKQKDDEVDTLYAQIVTYLGKISRLELTAKQNAEFLRLIEAVNKLESIGDLIETDLVALGKKRLDLNLEVSEPTQNLLKSYHRLIMKAVDMAIEAVSENNQDVANEVLQMKQDISDLNESAALHELKRLTADAPQRLEAYTTEIEIAAKFMRIYYLSKRMAKTVLPITE